MSQYRTDGRRDTYHTRENGQTRPAARVREEHSCYVLHCRRSAIQLVETLRTYV